MSGSHLYKIPPDFTLHNQVRLIRGGSEFFKELIGLINLAKESIHIQVYIFDDDETGRMVAEALKSAAQRNVRVFVLVDGYASRRLRRSFVNDLRNAGIHFKFFEPLFWTRRFYFGRRLHHKLFVIDGKYAFAGGLNISDNYNDLPGKKAWLDFALFVQGQASHQLYDLCSRSWGSEKPSRTSASEEIADFTSGEKSGPTCRVALRRNDWVRRKNQVSTTYSRMLVNAQKEVIILSSYFLPGLFLRRLLARATARGVKVKIITAGVSDIPIAKHAERFIYYWLLSKDVEIYEYQPGILHGKVAVCDSETATIGSYNINNLSAYASIELNLEIADRNFAESTRSSLLQIINYECLPVTSKSNNAGNTWLRFLKRGFMFSLIQAGLFLSTFYFRHTVSKKTAIDQTHFPG